jgi:hypothetical protein
MNVAEFAGATGTAAGRGASCVTEPGGVDVPRVDSGVSISAPGTSTPLLFCTVRVTVK